MATSPGGPDVSLRPLEYQDAAALFGLVDANRAHLRRWLPWVDGTRTVDDARAFVREAGAQRGRGRGTQYGLWLGPTLVGVIGQHPIDWPNRSVALGYWLAADYQGRGLMTRACQMLIGECFDDLGLHRVEIRVAPANHRSRAIPERLGFREEGVLRDAEWLYGSPVDLVVYGLLAPEWRARVARP